MERVILVDHADNPVSRKEKLAAHRDGDLHRAFSVYVVQDGKLLLQKRADGKYHSPGLWTNTACGHPRDGESVEDAAARRLHEELGMTATLRRLTTLTYRADVGDGLTEHEILHVFAGTDPSEPEPNPEEASAVEWRPIQGVFDDVEKRPERYTAWFRIVLPQLRTDLLGR